MQSEPMKIVIKAPNQMTDDQIVNCDRLWAVRQLKEHLFKEYPTHPKPDSQKLIYSGKLLADKMILKDVLKIFGGHEYSTIHLVCSIRESSRNAKVPSSQSSNKSKSDSLQCSSSVAGPQLRTNNGNEANRAANPSSCFFGNVVPETTVQQTYSQQDMAQQMIFIQQAYLQYMANFVRLENNGNHHLEPETNELPNEQVNREAPQNNNNVDAEIEEDGVAQRDWLEWIYILTRIIVLFSVVYFYSSPLRFFVVMTMALLLFNMDVERWRRRQDDTPDNAQRRHAETGATNSQQSDNINHPNPLSIFSTFVTSFFLSLIPEQRAI